MITDLTVNLSPQLVDDMARGLRTNGRNETLVEYQESATGKSIRERWKGWLILEDVTEALREGGIGAESIRVTH